jgi:retinol dehydrogenase-8
MTLKTVVITGCSTGIGKSLAISLAKSPEKYVVFATMRDPSKETISASVGDHFNKSIFVKKLDVCCQDSCNSFIKEVLEKQGRIDVLVNNAGVGLAGPIEAITVDAAKANFETNFFGVYRLIQLVVPHMKKQNSGQIISVSSVGGVNGVPFNDVYCATKFAVEGLSESLQPTLRAFNIKVNLIEPGPVLTQFTTNVVANSGDAINVDNLSYIDDKTKTIYNQMRTRMLAGFTPATAETGDQCAEKIKHVIEAENPPFRTQTNETQAYKDMIKSKLTDVSGDSTLDGMYKRFFA